MFTKEKGIEPCLYDSNFSCRLASHKRFMQQESDRNLENYHGNEDLFVN
jgi:hypothetical protein